MSTLRCDIATSKYGLDVALLQKSVLRLTVRHANAAVSLGIEFSISEKKIELLSFIFSLLED